MNPYYGGVGSRRTPADILELMVRIGKVFCDLGWGLSSGAALGADQAFWNGALLSKNFPRVQNRIYLAWEGMGGHRHAPESGFHDATRYGETYEIAEEMAFQARGSFEGLGRGGKALHIRNVYQVHGHCLTVPIKGLIYWGIPVGKGEQVQGGTNTALQLSIKAGVVDRINLYKEADRQRAEDFLRRYE